MYTANINISRAGAECPLTPRLLVEFNNLMAVLIQKSLRRVNMIVVNVDSPEAQSTTYIAQQGRRCKNALNKPFMKSDGVLCMGGLCRPATRWKEHIDAVEEVYFMLAGEGLMKVVMKRDK